MEMLKVKSDDDCYGPVRDWLLIILPKVLYRNYVPNAEVGDLGLRSQIQCCER